MGVVAIRRGLLDFAKSSSGQILIGISSSTIAVGTVFYRFIEDWSWLDSLYFSVITLTTVGYGDFSPQTNFGKLFTVFYVLIGIGIFVAFLNEIAHQIVSARKQRESSKTQD